MSCLDAETLEFHYLNIDMMTVYKFLFVLINVDLNEYFAFKQDGATRGSSGHNFCLVQNNGRVDARWNYFAVRTIKPWNSLPAACYKI